MTDSPMVGHGGVLEIAGHVCQKRELRGLPLLGLEQAFLVYLDLEEHEYLACKAFTTSHLS
jgi:hypothetical protein